MTGPQKVNVEDILEVAADFETLLATGAGSATLHQRLQSLRELAGKHFNEEQQFMAAASYPEVSKHTAKHQEFLAYLSDLEGGLDQDDAARERAQTGRAAVYVRSWLVHHVAYYDLPLDRLKAQQPPRATMVGSDDVLRPSVPPALP